MTITRQEAEKAAQEVLAGLIERVTFHNAENGFCVLRALSRWVFRQSSVEQKSSHFRLFRTEQFGEFRRWVV